MKHNLKINGADHEVSIMEIPNGEFFVVYGFEKKVLNRQGLANYLGEITLQAIREANMMKAKA